MLKEKQFTLKEHESGMMILYEIYSKRVSHGIAKYRLLYVLNSDLQIVEPHVEHDGNIVSLTAYAEALGKTKTEVLSQPEKQGITLCYRVQDMGYIGEHHVVTTDGEITSNLLDIYMPFDVLSSGKLRCRDVTLMFPPRGRRQVHTRNAQFVFERLQGV